MRRNWFITTFAAGLALAALWFGSPAEGRDRPGTPNKEGFGLCGYARGTYTPLLCGQFNNTASEEVRIEIEETKNGAPFAMDTSQFNCSDMMQRPVKNWEGGTTYIPLTICYTIGHTYQRKRDDPDVAYVFETGSVDWGAQYCVRFRARRVSDGVVSEHWSNYACATVPPPPAVPPRPDFGISFSGSQSYTSGNAQPGEVSRVVPQSIQIAPTPIDGREQMMQLKVGSQSLQWTSEPDPKKLAFSIPPGTPTLAVELCAYNYSGHTCRLKTIDVLAQNVQSLGMPGNRVPLPAVAPTASPVASEIFKTPGNGSDRYMVGVDLPGSDYRNQPIDGTAVDCRALCTRDGLCKAWTWVKAGIQNASAMCWLKNAVPATRPKNANVTSGITSSAPIIR